MTDLLCKPDSSLGRLTNISPAAIHAGLPARKRNSYTKRHGDRCEAQSSSYAFWQGRTGGYGTSNGTNKSETNLESRLVVSLRQANVQGPWVTLNTQMPLNPIHVSLMHNGRVLIVSGSGNLPSDTTYLGAVWDPTTDTVTTQPVPFDMFCNGMVVLPDGRPFVISGTATR